MTDEQNASPSKPVDLDFLDSQEAPAVTFHNITFANYTDMQTRLLLLPLNDEECLGAVVSSYTASNEGLTGTKDPNDADKGDIQRKKSLLDSDSEEENDESVESVSEVEEEEEEEEEANVKIKASESQEEHQNENSGESITSHLHLQGILDLACGPISTASSSEEKKSEDVGVDEDEDENEDENNDILAATPTNMEGYILTGINGIEIEQNWTTCEFSTILAHCREAPTPIVLQFTPPQNSTDAFKDSDVEAESAHTPPTKANLTKSFSRWSSRMRSTTSSLVDSAAEAATKAKDNARTVAAERLRALEKTMDQTTMEEHAFRNHPEREAFDCTLFLQSLDGSFVNVASTTKKKKQKQINITNTSLLSCRQSNQTPLSTSYSYQWLKTKPLNSSSFTTHSSSQSLNASIHSTNSTHSFNKGASPIKSSTDNSVEYDWIPIAQATSAVFQPSATEIGYLLQCQLYMDSSLLYSCQTDRIVQADPSLFKAAKKTKTPGGAKFNSLKGGGNAIGRSFSVQIQSLEETKCTLFQVSGSTAEPLHDPESFPLWNPSAQSSHSDPKKFQLFFLQLQEGHSLVSALMGENGNDQAGLILSAPNRISRESLLLSLGIANFRGKSNTLTPSTILFDDLPKKEFDQPVSASSMEEDHPDTEEQLTNGPMDESSPKATSPSQIVNLENDILRMAKKLAAKDKVISELQRSLSSSDSENHNKDVELNIMKLQLQKYQSQSKDLEDQLHLAEKRYQTLEDQLDRAKKDVQSQRMEYEERLSLKQTQAQDFDKSMKALENEKAVLAAAVEARDGKLESMEECRVQIADLEKELKQQKDLQFKMDELQNQNNALETQLRESESKHEEESDQLDRAQTYITKLQSKLDSSETHYSTVNTKLLQTQTQNQKLKTERNKYKQKSDSLSKEMSRICRNGLQIHDIESIIENQEAMQSEIKILQAGKQQALRDLHECRMDYGNMMRAKDIAGGDYNISRILEQRAELEKVVENLTEYVQAKEMQIETMREVNKSLMTELASSQES